MPVIYNVPKWHIDSFNRFDDPESRKDIEYSGFLKDFNEDVFSRMYSNEFTPRKKDVSDWQKWAIESHKILDQIEEYKALVERVQGNSYYSYKASEHLSKRAWENLPKEVLENSQKVKETGEVINLLTDLLQEQGQNENLEKLLDQKKQELGELLQDQKNINPQELRPVLRKAISQISEKISDTQKAVSVLPGINPSDLETGNTSYLSIFETIMRSKKIQEILFLAGRMFSLLEESRRRSKNYEASELAGIEQGNNLKYVLLEDMAVLKLSSGYFYNKYLEKKLNQYELKSRQKEVNGNIVVGIDFSGSMQTKMTNDLQRFQVASAFAIALGKLAEKKKKKFWAFTFNTELKGVFEKDQLLGLLSLNPTGGTDIGNAIEGIKGKINFDNTKTDLILITDGEDNSKIDLPEEVKLFIIGVNSHISNQNLGNRADKIYNVSDIIEAIPDIAKNIRR